MNINLNDILAFMRDYGLPVTILLAIIVSGSRGSWYFRAYVDDLKAQHKSEIEELKKQFAERLADKNAQAEGWQRASENNGASFQESLILARQMAESLKEIKGDLGEPRRRASGPMR